MDEFIQAIANGDWKAILDVITMALNGGLGIALVTLATKFLHYKKAVTGIVKEVKDEIVPLIEEMMQENQKNTVEELRKDNKVIAESVALSVNSDTESKIAVIENVSKIGASTENTEKAKVKVQEEVAKEEAKKEEVNVAIKELEENKIETL